MAKIKDKVQKTLDVECDIGKWIDESSVRMTRSGRGRSAFANECFKFVRANMTSFEYWWNNRGDASK